jgi:NAD(P)H-hydrate repair Nnr-like enzyme with NAD(P)H-hydrate dehydratase domain
MKVIDQALLEKVIIERCRHSHKGDYGRLLLLGGTYPYGGAIIMSAIAAVKSGAGIRRIFQPCTAIYLRPWLFLFKTSNC